MQESKGDNFMSRKIQGCDIGEQYDLVYEEQKKRGFKSKKPCSKCGSEVIGHYENGEQCQIQCLTTENAELKKDLQEMCEKYGRQHKWEYATPDTRALFQDSFDWEKLRSADGYFFDCMGKLARSIASKWRNKI